jgi:Ankyrin repeats (3 copies)
MKSKAYRKFIFSFIALLASTANSSAGLIHDAVKSRNYREVDRLLKENPEKINDQDEFGQTPLHWAVVIGDVRLLSRLALKGADYTIQNKIGQTPLFLAAHMSSSPEHLKIQKGFRVLLEWRQFMPDETSPNYRSYPSHSSEIISKMHALGLPIVYLTGGESGDQESPSYWRTGIDIKPTMRIDSLSGDHNLALPTSEVVIIGANWGYCHLHAAGKAMQQHFASNSKDFTIHLPVKAIHIGPGKPDRVLEFLDDNKKLDEVEHTFLPNTEIVWGDTGFKYDGKNYKFNIFLDGRLKKQAGNGSKIVNLKIWNDFDPTKHLAKNAL